jgi:hypothetical protein
MRENISKTTERKGPNVPPIPFVKRGEKERPEKKDSVDELIA